MSAQSVPWGPTPASVLATPQCTGRPNYWTFDTTLTETAGVAVHVIEGKLFVDGQPLAGTPTVINQDIPARGTMVRHPFICYDLGNGHSWYAVYSGTDANGHAVSVTTPTVTALPKPGGSLTSATVATSNNGAGSAR